MSLRLQHLNLPLKIGDLILNSLGISLNYGFLQHGSCLGLPGAYLQTLGSLSSCSPLIRAFSLEHYSWKKFLSISCALELSPQSLVSFLSHLCAQDTLHCGVDDIVIEFICLDCIQAMTISKPLGILSYEE